MLGKVLKYNRLRQQKRQEEVCEGICSVSYYSKIENDTANPSPEVLDMLMERLNINQQQIHLYDEKKLKEELHEWHRLIINGEVHNAEEKFVDLQQKVASLKRRKLSVLFELFFARMCLLINEGARAKEIIFQNENVIRDLNDSELFFYFLKVKAAREYYINNYAIAGELLELAEGKIDIFIHPRFETTDLYYMAGLCASKLNNSTLAIYYLSQVVDAFDSTYDYIKSGDCRLHLGKAYKALKKFKEAEENYSLASRIASQLKDQKVEAEIKQLVGEMYSAMGRHKGAVHQYQLSYRLREKEERLVTICAILEELNYLGHKPEMVSWVEHGMEIIRNIRSERELSVKEKVSLHKLIYYQVLSDPSGEKDAGKVISHEVIPFFENMDLDGFLPKAAGELARYYEKSGDYQSSSLYYKKAMEALQYSTP